jgi:hypothetical protein
VQVTQPGPPRPSSKVLADIANAPIASRPSRTSSRQSELNAYVQKFLIGGGTGNTNVMRNDPNVPLNRYGDQLDGTCVGELCRREIKSPTRGSKVATDQLYALLERVTKRIIATLRGHHDAIHRTFAARCRARHGDELQRGQGRDWRANERDAGPKLKSVPPRQSNR